MRRYLLRMLLLHVYGLLELVVLYKEELMHKEMFWLQESIQLMVLVLPVRG